jgi:hypothetical protein
LIKIRKYIFAVDIKNDGQIAEASDENKKN